MSLNTEDTKPKPAWVRRMHGKATPAMARVMCWQSLSGCLLLRALFWR